jgi:hypothetical protein
MNELLDNDSFSFITNTEVILCHATYHPIEELRLQLSNILFQYLSTNLIDSIILSQYGANKFNELSMNRFCM